MHHSVEVSSGLLDLFSHLIVAIEVEDISDEVEGVLIVVDFGVETSQVESVGKVFFVDLAKVFVATGRDELEDGVSKVPCLDLSPANSNTNSTQVADTEVIERLDGTSGW